MGRGLAYQAKMKYPNLPKELGSYIKDHGNIVFVFEEYRLLTFPVKHNWWELADLKLIEESTKQLKELLLNHPWISPIYMPHIGCGNGGLKWNTVKKILEIYLDSRFIICDLV
jgi:hypothetical protein